MENIEQIELIESQINNWEFNDIVFIKEVHYNGCFEQDDGSLNSKLTLVTLSQPRSKKWPNLKSDFWEIIFDFYGIQELKIDYHGTDDIQVLGLEIIDLKESQLENIKMKAFDYEMGILSFYAKSVSVKSCRRVNPVIKTNHLSRTHKIR